MALAATAVALLSACASPPRAPAAAAPAPALPSASAVVPTTAIAGVVAAGTRIEFLRDGFDGTEGPLGLPDGSLLFTENRKDRVLRIAPDGSVSAFAEGLNGSNALARRADGALLAVQTLSPQVGVVHPASQRRVLARDYEGRAFGRPNDLVLDRQGNLYFTDSGPNAPAPGAAPAAAPASTAPPAVYRITAAGQLQRLATGIVRPNGIQLSPDERVLYVANTGGEHLLAFDIAPDGRAGPARSFARLDGYRRTATGWASGADGLAVDAQGRVYAATSVGVQVFAPDGQALGTIVLPRAPQNLAFAGLDRKTLYVVGRGAAWRLPVLTAGVEGRAK